MSSPGLMRGKRVGMIVCLEHLRISLLRPPLAEMRLSAASTLLLALSLGLCEFFAEHVHLIFCGPPSSPPYPPAHGTLPLCPAAYTYNVRLWLEIQHNTRQNSLCGNFLGIRLSTCTVSSTLIVKVREKPKSADPNPKDCKSQMEALLKTGSR